MPRVTPILRVGMTVILCVIIALPAVVSATTTALVLADQPTVIITEIQTSSSKSASEEFVELFNNTDSDVDFADTANQGKDIWKLQFFSSTSVAQGTPDWTKPSVTVALTGKIAAHDYYVVASNQASSGGAYQPGGVEADQSYTPRLADTGGGLQLIDSTTTATTAHDRLMWSQASPLPIGVYAAPGNGNNLQRVPAEDGQYVEATNQITPFSAVQPISPKDRWYAPVPEPDPVDNTIDPTENTQDNSAASPVLPPVISELLPNPASPQTDANDEFIEVYNPNNAPINLRGYSLETGTTTLHDFTFSEDTIIEENAYRAFYSIDTHLALGNSGGVVSLLDPSGAIISQTGQYTTAADGVAWALIGNQWLWTAQPTPNASNALVALNSPVKKPAVKTIKLSVKGASTTKTKKTTTKKTTKAKKKTTKKSTLASTNLPVPAPPVHATVLVVVVAGALLYGAYEYRHDVANRIRQYRANRAARRASRPAPARR